MSASSDSDGDPAGSASSNGGATGAADAGVLSQLPRTRPQRSSPRRDAARRAAQPGSRAKPASKTQPKPAAKAAKPAPRAAKAPARAKRAASSTRGVTATTPSHATPKRIRAAAQPAATPVPRQGFESESDRARGPVRPPGGTELLTSAVEIVGELTKAGLSTGERLVRDVFSLLPRS